MPLNIKTNNIGQSVIGISVPETMDGEVSGNTVIGADVAIEVRGSEQRLIDMLQEGFPGDKLNALILELQKVQANPMEQKVELVEKSGLTKWIKPGITIAQLVTALAELASSFS